MLLITFFKKRNEKNNLYNVLLWGPFRQLFSVDIQNPKKIILLLVVFFWTSNSRSFEIGLSKHLCISSSCLRVRIGPRKFKLIIESGEENKHSIEYKEHDSSLLPNLVLIQSERNIDSH